MTTIEVTINRGKGQKQVLLLPLHQETTSGYVCVTGEGVTSPATEWFPKDSSVIKSKEVV